jgi:hypothetical protein
LRMPIAWFNQCFMMASIKALIRLQVKCIAKGSVLPLTPIQHTGGRFGELKLLKTCLELE